ncbi:hypothetical protein A6770_32100 [Nostoc minutum NIES-26]|uniref:Phosphoesterase n=1 Tax=Nostoc minutum NIES-26 TaxID=1844469 RepID=A0A367Q695_9NOSO|nr:hypothetical protein A6770_32100 [Nostoc minutum NIES-26]
MMEMSLLFNKKLIFVLCGLVSTWTFSPIRTLAIDFSLSPEEDDPVLLWNQITLQAISNTTLGPTPASRALGMVHTSIFDAWAAYDPVAIGTQLGDTLQVLPDLITVENKRQAINYAAYNTLVDLFPTQKPLFNDLMNKQGYDYSVTSTDINTAAGIGNFVAQKLLDFRHIDGSNQLNNYADTSGYKPVNTWDKIIDPNHWQPLSVDNGQNVQKFLTPHWGNVTPFALKSGEQFLPPSPAQFGTQKYIDQALEIIEYSAELTDEQKVIAEYWADGPHTELPPGHWNLFGEFVSVRDGLSLDDNVKLFFGLSNAVFDAGVAVWDAKEYYDYVRPITAIRYLASNHLLPDDNPYVRTNPETGIQEIFTWGGPDQGSKWIDGSTWLPYQKISFVTPPFAEYVSGHSAYSAAGAEILKRFTGSDDFGGCHTQLANSSTFESNTPAVEVQLCWDTFSNAADEAGISRRYGGIHFEDGDIYGRTIGRKVGTAVWDKTQFYINGGKQAQNIPEPTPVLGLLASAILSFFYHFNQNKIK